jgi:hypothetical protein
MADVTGLLMIPKKGKGAKSPYPESEDMPEDDTGMAPESDEPTMGSAKSMAAEDALAAFEAKDAEALSDALTRHYEACASGE